MLIISIGLLCVTFTDMAVLCGNYGETCLYKYGTIPIKRSYCHEMAKRIALYSISSIAARYKKVIKPLISFNANFYIRLFLIVNDSPDDCKKNGLRYGYIHQCRQCQNRSTTPISYIEDRGKKTGSYKFNNLSGENTCKICDGNMFLAGPFWISELHDKDFVDLVIKELESEEFKYLKYNSRVHGFVSGMKDVSKLLLIN